MFAVDGSDVHEGGADEGSHCDGCSVTATGGALLVSSPRKLAEILLAGSQLSGDRRSTRYQRQRKAVAAGLESPEILKVKGEKRKTHLRNESKAVDPELSQEVIERLLHLARDEKRGF